MFKKKRITNKNLLYKKINKIQKFKKKKESPRAFIEKRDLS